MTQTNGVGPHPKPWPTEDHFDPELLENGDRRNVLDEYRYWKESAIKEAMAKNSIELEIAIENVERDFNMGTIVRSANAFGVSKIHILGRKTWNKRGAMATDHYVQIEYHSQESFLQMVQARGRALIAIDITESSDPLDSTKLPNNALLLFGSEAQGVSQQLLAASQTILHIEQRGSTRSINVGVAAGIAMYRWLQDNALTHHI